MDKKFAIFDMDGTLVESMLFWRNIGAEWLENHGITVDRMDLRLKLKKKNLIEIARYIIEVYGFDMQPEKIREEINDLMEQHYRHDVVAKEFMVNKLKEYKARGVKMCIASATPTYLIEICLKKVKLYDYFDFLLSCKDVGHDKSAPTVYLEAKRRLAPEVAIEDVAVFEDSLYALRTAKRAGFYTVAIPESTNAHDWDTLKEEASEYIE